MRCPCCTKDLVITHYDHYESLDEHVSNRAPSMKKGYQCTYPYCAGNNLGITWIEDGEPFADPPMGIKNTVAFDIIKKISVTGNYYALDSWGSKYETMKSQKEKGKRTINVHKWKIDIYPVFVNVNDEWERKRFRFSADIWQKSEDGTYIGVVPFHRMVSHVLRKFKNNKKRAIEGDSNAVEECYRDLACITPWGKPEKRFYARFSSVLLKILYPSFSMSLLKMERSKNE
jgi:hypothetical protein